MSDESVFERIRQRISELAYRDWLKTDEGKRYTAEMKHFEAQLLYGDGHGGTSIPAKRKRK